MTYLLAFTVSLLFAASAQHSKKQSGFSGGSLALLSLSALSLLSVQLFREGVGTDYYDVYVDQYNTFLSTGQSRFEVGFTVLMRLSSLLSTDYHFLLGLCSSFIIIGVYCAIYRSRSNYLVAVALFVVSGFFFYSMNGIRQSMAIALLMNAAVSYENDRKGQFLFLVFAATSIHLYSFVALVLLFVPHIKKLKGIHIALLFIAVCLLSGPLTAFAVRVGSMFSEQIRTYVAVPHLREMYLTGDFDVLDFLLCILPLLVIAAERRMRCPDERFHLGDSYQIMLFAGLLATGLSCSLAICARVAVYFSPFSIICMGTYCENNACNKKGHFWLMYAYFTASIAILFFYYFVRNFSAVFPYTSLLFP